MHISLPATPVHLTSPFKVHHLYIRFKPCSWLSPVRSSPGTTWIYGYPNSLIFTFLPNIMQKKKNKFLYLSETLDLKYFRVNNSFYKRHTFFRNEDIKANALKPILRDLNFNCIDNWKPLRDFRQIWT